MVPGFKVAADAGVPPGKLQLYDKVSDVGAQDSTFAIGFIVADPQKSFMGSTVAVGGCLTSIVSEAVSIPQEFVVVKVKA